MTSAPDRGGVVVGLAVVRRGASMFGVRGALKEEKPPSSYLNRIFLGKPPGMRRGETEA